MRKKRDLYYWVPSLYMLEGLPFAFITNVSLIFFKNFNFNNIQIAFYTSLFALPWLLKPLISPIIEHTVTKQFLLLLMPTFQIVILFLLIVSLFFDNFFYFSVSLFFMMAFTASIFDINADGLYLTSLDRQSQTYFLGIRTISYQIGRLLAQGGIVFLASSFFIIFSLKTSWQIAFGVLALFIGAINIFHYYFLPRQKITTSSTELKMKNQQHLRRAYLEFIQIPFLFQTILFAFFYPFAENQLIKIVPLFLLDKAEKGGLALTTLNVSLLSGTIGVISMLVGILLSGFILTKKSLRASLLPITLLVFISNGGYLFLSLSSIHSLYIIAIIIAIAQFIFGLSNGVYMLYLFERFSKGIYPMSCYAIGTTLMGLSALFGGLISGYLQFLLGYTGFFSWIILLSICIFIFASFLKLEEV